MSGVSLVPDWYTLYAHAVVIVYIYDVKVLCLVSCLSSLLDRKARDVLRVRSKRA